MGPRLLLAGGLGLALAIAVVTVLLLLSQRERALAETRRELTSLSLVLAEQADRSIESLELLQTSLLERMQANGLYDPDDFRRQMSGQDMHEELKGRTRNLPQLDAITAIDVNGKLVNFSRYWPIPAVNVADRDYFQALKASPTLQRFISVPVRNRGTGTWTIYVARRVSSPNGEFLGLILGAIELAYFQRLYESVAPGPASSISLIRDDGILLARHPHQDASVGQSLADRPLFRQLTAGGRQGLGMETSQLDGLARIAASHRLGRYPMLVAVTTTVDAALADWRHEAGFLVAAALVLETLLAGFGVLVMRQMQGQQQLADANAGRLTAEAARRDAEAGLVLARQREAAERTLSLHHARFGAALANMSQALCMFDGNGHLVVANRQVPWLFGASRAARRQGSQPGTTFDDLMRLAETGSRLAGSDIEGMRTAVAQLLAERKPSSHVRELADGRSLLVHFRPMDDDGWLATIEDITERRQAEVKIAHMAHHDALTGLPNRVHMQAALRRAIQHARRGDPCAVLCLDLDQFKSVNDTLGHPVGDALLRAVTERLLHEVREVDTVARLGGDEFAIVQAGVNQPQDAKALAARLVEAISAPYEVEGHQVIVGVSIGIAVAPSDGDDPHTLLKNADMALYRAKEEGRGRFRFFEAEMDAQMQARRSLEMDLRRALAQDEFRVFYQPLVGVQTQTVTGFEALVRWQHPTRGMVSPASFIPLAEEIGLIVPLGRWVLRQACADAASWPGTPKVAVNLSPAQFASPCLVQDVADALAASGLAPARLELEITETVMLADTGETMETLHKLRALGARIAMDDFGTGYSSLSYLRRFPFDKVKIDRSFIAGMGQGGDCDAIVTAVTDLCDQLGIRTTAEGVETQEQLERLSRGSCTEAQGYWFSRPRPAEEVPELCARLGERATVPG